MRKGMEKELGAQHRRNAEKDHEESEEHKKIETVDGTYSSLMIMTPFPNKMQCWMSAGGLDKKLKSQNETNIAMEGGGGIMIMWEE